MKQRCCILGKRSSHFGLVDVDFLDTPFCHLQMTRYRRIRWTLWDFGRYATPTPLMSFFFSLQLATVFLGIWRQFQLRWLELFLWIFVFGIVFFNCLGIPTFFPLKKKTDDTHRIGENLNSNILRMWWIWDLKVDLFEVQNWQKASCALVDSIVSWRWIFHRLVFP